jgi:hypothetical protein
MIEILYIVPWISLRTGCRRWCRAASTTAAVVVPCANIAQSKRWLNNSRLWGELLPQYLALFDHPLLPLEIQVRSDAVDDDSCKLQNIRSEGPTNLRTLRLPSVLILSWKPYYNLTRRSWLSQVMTAYYRLLLMTPVVTNKRLELLHPWCEALKSKQMRRYMMCRQK